MKNLPLKVLTANKATTNGRIYSSVVLEHAIEEFNSRKFPCVCNNHGNHNHVDMAEVTHVVSSLELKGDDLIANIDILDTPRGKMLQTMISVLGIDKFNVFPVGVGTLKNRKIVNDGFIITGVVIQPTGE